MKTHVTWEPRGTFRSFWRNHASANAHARSVRKSLVQFSVSFRQVAACFCNSVFGEFRLSAQFLQDFPHKGSAGLSKLPLDFPQGFRTDACRQLLPKSLRIYCPWLGLKEGECATRTQCPAELVRQTVREQMLTNRASWTSTEFLRTLPPLLKKPPTPVRFTKQIFLRTLPLLLRTLPLF